MLWCFLSTIFWSNILPLSKCFQCGYEFMQLNIYVLIMIDIDIVIMIMIHERYPTWIYRKNNLP